MIPRRNYPFQLNSSITMVSYESLDLLQLQLYSTTSLDYDIDVRIAQYANIFGKGFSEHNHPIEMILAGTYGFGSSDSPDSSRSPSIGQDDVRTESSAAETLSSPSIQDHERIRYRSALTHLSKFMSDILADPLMNHIQFHTSYLLLVQPLINRRSLWVLSQLQIMES